MIPCDLRHCISCCISRYPAMHLRFPLKVFGLLERCRVERRETPNIALHCNVSRSDTSHCIALGCIVGTVSHFASLKKTLGMQELIAISPCLCFRSRLSKVDEMDCIACLIQDKVMNEVIACVASDNTNAEQMQTKLSK